ncbi:hypothetical protein Bca52824_031836 [Brassica carinata]|uniref:Uncharacterized protein n=1 Tax=Brassica carinata TaxID=52824 RepID=A0A8X7SAS7_BRACI|nr:hypothetical protein Bca52824_031836 [Brassica carinata]
MKDYCTNSNFYPIRKDPPEDGGLCKDTPESHPIEKIATPQAPSQEKEEIEDSFDFGNQVIKHISKKKTQYRRLVHTSKWFNILSWITGRTRGSSNATSRGEAQSFCATAKTDNQVSGLCLSTLFYFVYQI